MSEASSPVPRRTLACERCGCSFGCLNDSTGHCWCRQQSFRLPQPLPTGVGPFADCLCPSCLREIAAELARLYPEMVPGATRARDTTTSSSAPRTTASDGLGSETDA